MKTYNKRFQYFYSKFLLCHQDQSTIIYIQVFLYRDQCPSSKNLKRYRTSDCRLMLYRKSNSHVPAKRKFEWPGLFGSRGLIQPLNASPHLWSIFFLLQTPFFHPLLSFLSSFSKGPFAREGRLLPEHVSPSTFGLLPSFVDHPRDRPFLLPAWSPSFEIHISSEHEPFAFL